MIRMTPEEYFKEFVMPEKKQKILAPTPPQPQIVREIYYPYRQQNILLIPLIIAIISLALIALILAIKK